LPGFDTSSAWADDRRLPERAREDKGKLAGVGEEEFAPWSISPTL
jgi:hypothetical protein